MGEKIDINAELLDNLPEVPLLGTREKIGVMFTIIITEKGGAERRESFDRNEITVGRVQGNDLMLPKGNVSKQHARLLYRDGRFIVTDLKSTNGTYVNGRKIAQATIVREGDKIYVGDFVLRLDSAASTVGPNPVLGTDEIRDPLGDVLPPPNEGFGQPGAPAPFGLGTGQAAAVAQPPPQQAAVSADTPFGVPMPAPPQVSPSRAPSSQQVPVAPQVPQFPPAFGGMSAKGGTLALPPQAALQPPPHQSVAPAPMPSKPPSVAPPPASPSRAPAPYAPPRASNMPAKPKDSPEVSARKLALVMLVDRLETEIPEGVVSESRASQIEEAVRKAADEMASEGELPESVDVRTLIADAVAECSGNGPMDGWLDDEDVVEVICSRFDQIQVRRVSSGTSSAEVVFSSEGAFARAIRRLVNSTEALVEKRVGRAFVAATLPPVSNHASLSIRKRRKAESTFEDLVRLGGLSRPMATFLEAVVSAKASVLIVGSSAPTGSALVGAVASALGPLEKVVFVGDHEDLVAPHLHVISVPGSGELDESLHALRPEKLLATTSQGTVLRYVAQGVEQFAVSVVAPNIRQGLSRLVQQLVAKGIPHDAAKDFVVDAFDTVIEAHPSERGVRVARISELAGADSRGLVLRDIFTAGDGEGGWAPTGTTPRIVTDLSQRGVRIDPNLFKRASR